MLVKTIPLSGGTCAGAGNQHLKHGAGAGHRHPKCRLALTGTGTGTGTYKISLTGTDTENRHQVPVPVPALKVPVDLNRHRHRHHLPAPAPAPPGADFIPGTRLYSQFFFNTNINNLDYFTLFYVNMIFYGKCNVREKSRGFYKVHFLKMPGLFCLYIGMC